jgi:hypothetical protein
MPRAVSSANGSATTERVAQPADAGAHEAGGHDREGADAHAPEGGVGEAVAEEREPALHHEGAQQAAHDRDQHARQQRALHEPEGEDLGEAGHG